MVSSKKKWTVMNPIRRPMKKRNPSSGQNGQLVHWWVLIHSGPPCSLTYLDKGKKHHLLNYTFIFGELAKFLFFW
jgi:hypothetical protein